MENERDFEVIADALGSIMMQAGRALRKYLEEDMHEFRVCIDEIEKEVQRIKDVV